MKYNEKTIEKIVAAIENGGTHIAACGYAGISKETFYVWMREKHDFSDRVKRAEEKAQAADENALNNIIRNPDHKNYFPALLFRLKTRWGFRENIGISGEIGVKATVDSSGTQKVWDALSEQDRRDIEEKLLAAANGGGKGSGSEVD